MALDNAIETVLEGDVGVGYGITVVDISRYYLLEVEHVLNNFEMMEIGQLRFDQGAMMMYM